MPYYAGLRLEVVVVPISESALEHTVNWYFSLDNIIAANDRLLQFMDRLELPNLMRRSADRLHTSSDGQKFEVRADSLNANYSYKYFGKGQGVSAYTFRDERDLLWYSLVFSAADRESAYVIDGLMHNDVVRSDIHSTDAFGYSEAIFATSHLLGFSYAPRFKNLKRQRLYIFKNRQKDDRSTWQIKPTGYCECRSRLPVLGRHFTLHRHDQTQGDDRLRSLSAAQLLLETARTLSSHQSLRANTQESFYPACDRRAGAAYGHRKSAQWSRTYTPFHARGVGRESA